MKKYDAIVKNVKESYSRTKTHKDDYFGYINEFSKTIEKILGNNVNINNENIYIQQDTYVINHDHNGFPIKNPFIIRDGEGKIKLQKNHNFFKQDVIFYFNNKLKIQVFYNAISLLLLGYKEVNRDFEYSRRKNIYLKVNYSVINRLKMIGYKNKHIDISEKVKNMKHENKKISDQDILKKIIADISRERIVILKKMIHDIQRYINKIKYSYFGEYNEDNPDSFLENYKDKLKKIEIGNDKSTFMKYWKVINENVMFHNLENRTVNLDIKSEYFLYDEISDYDYHGNIILYYIVNEFSKLISFNQSKFIKVHLTYLIIDIINKIHLMFSEKYINTNFEVKRFNYQITSKFAIHDIESAGLGLDITDFYKDDDIFDKTEEDMSELLEEKHIAEEEFNSIDIEVDEDGTGLDYQIDYA